VPARFNCHHVISAGPILAGQGRIRKLSVGDDGWSLGHNTRRDRSRDGAFRARYKDGPKKSTNGVGMITPLHLVGVLGQPPPPKTEYICIPDSSRAISHTNILNVRKSRSSCYTCICRWGCLPYALGSARYKCMFRRFLLGLACCGQ